MMNRSTYMNLKGSLLDSPLREYRLKKIFTNLNRSKQRVDNRVIKIEVE